MNPRSSARKAVLILTRKPEVSRMFIRVANKSLINCPYQYPRGLPFPTPLLRDSRDRCALERLIQLSPRFNQLRWKSRFIRLDYSSREPLSCLIVLDCPSAWIAVSRKERDGKEDGANIRLFLFRSRGPDERYPFLCLVFITCARKRPNLYWHLPRKIFQTTNSATRVRLRNVPAALFKYRTPSSARLNARFNLNGWHSTPRFSLKIRRDRWFIISRAYFSFSLALPLSLSLSLSLSRCVASFLSRRERERVRQRAARIFVLWTSRGVPGGRETRPLRTPFLKPSPVSRRRTSRSASSLPLSSLPPRNILIYSMTAPASRESRKIQRISSLTSTRV